MVERPLRPSVKGRLEWSKTEGSGAGRRLSGQTRSKGTNQRDNGSSMKKQ